MKISIIAAIGQNRELGKDNKLLWKIPGELSRFKKITMGHPIIMGRLTFESIGRVLPGRTNIIVTRNKNFKVPGAVIVDSLMKGVETAKMEDKQEIFIIGGGQVFEQAIDVADKLYLTIVHKSFEADTFFPEYSEFRKKIDRIDMKSPDFNYEFLTLEK